MSAVVLIRARLRTRPGHFMPESLIDSRFAALETPPDALVDDIDQPVGAIVFTMILELKLPNP